jgi:hypothetical protein
MKHPSLAQVTGFALGAAALSVPFLVFADDTFVPLTQLPGISKISASAISLPSIINNLYMICIGLAAFFALTQIIQAGYLFMTSADSISKNTKARAKIMNAVIGLVIVLSPFVVFSVINPKILDISLNFGKLQSNNGNAAGTTAPANSGESGGDSTCTSYTNPTVSDLGTCGTAVPIAAKCCAGMDTSGNFQCCATPK